VIHGLYPDLPDVEEAHTVHTAKPVGTSKCTAYQSIGRWHGMEVVFWEGRWWASSLELPRCVDTTARTARRPLRSAILALALQMALVDVFFVISLLCCGVE